MIEHYVQPPMIICNVCGIGLCHLVLLISTVFLRGVDHVIMEDLNCCAMANLNF